MGTPRSIEVLLSVFDLHVTEIFSRNEGASTRVVFTFDRKSGTRKFRLVDSKIPQDLNDRIEEWLSKNVDEERVAYGIEPKGLYLRRDSGSFCEADI
jgi:hypothetical protein